MRAVYCDRCGGRNRDLACFCRTCGSAIASLENSARVVISPSETITLPLVASERVADRYVLLDELGSGGMGVVYGAYDPVLERSVAIKLIRRDLSEDPAAVQRFLKEARIAARLRHPNIVSIHDIGHSGQGHFYVMDFIEGRNLGALVARRGSLPAGDAEHIILEAARGISFAHDAGVLHRDLKPENVMLDNAGNVLVLDFGIARAIADPRITQHGALLGSPPYMSPEQLDGRDVDRRSDIFSLGLMYYFLLAGRPLFEGDSIRAIQDQHHRCNLDATLTELDLPSEALSLLKKMLAPDPRERLAELVFALHARPSVAQARAIDPSAIPTPSRRRRPRRPPSDISHSPASGPSP